MKAATVVQIKKELQHRNTEDLLEICLRLSKFKKENKELLTYLLFEAEDEEGFVHSIKAEVDGWFSELNTTSYYFIKKSVRKILSNLKKYARYSGKKETEVELLLYFCEKLRNLKPSFRNNTTLLNLYERQAVYIEKKINLLHEDLQYDYGLLLEKLKNAGYGGLDKDI